MNFQIKINHAKCFKVKATSKQAILNTENEWVQRVPCKFESQLKKLLMDDTHQQTPQVWEGGREEKRDSYMANIKLKLTLPNKDTTGRLLNLGLGNTKFN